MTDEERLAILGPEIVAAIRSWRDAPAARHPH